MADGTTLNTTSLPKFLGVRAIDGALSFGPHVAVVVSTDGSASAGTKDGGAGVIVTRGDPTDPTILHQSHLRGAAFTSSFAEVAAAMQLALEWATTTHPEYSLTICTDSQSLLKAIERRSLVTHHLRSLLYARPGPMNLLWIPGHKGIPGNELADTAAKAATLTNSDPPRPISYASARSLIRRTFTDPPPTNPRTVEEYGGFSWSKDCTATSNRADAVLLARL